jgi:protein-tyrosine phosphatase
VDFDPHSLRATLPTAVAALERARRNHGRVYVHCTAGLGRSPAVAIAALYWFTDMDLDTAYMYLTGIRPCGKIDFFFLFVFERSRPVGHF